MQHTAPGFSHPLGRGALAVVAIVAAGVTSASRPAQARRVVVLSVSGPGYKPVRRFLEEQVSEEHTLIPHRRALAASRELDIPRRRWFKGDTLSQIARKIGADAVVTARIYKYRGHWWIGLQVRDGATGKVAKQGIASYRWLALTRKTRKRLGRILRAGIDRAKGVPYPRRRAVPLPEPVRPRPTEPSTKSQSSRLGPRPTWMTAVNAGLGVRLGGRSLSFKGIPSNPGSITLYDTSSPVVPLLLHAEAYPGAFLSRHPAWANLGLGLRFDYAFGLTSRRSSDNSDVGTTAWDLDFYLTYRLHVKGSKASPVLHFDLGVAVADFSFAEDLGVVPSVRHVSLKLGLRGLFSILANRLFAGFTAAGLATLTSGQMTDAAHYGPATAGGFQLALELSVRLFWKVYLRVGAETTWTFLAFRQTGTLGTDYAYEALSARDGSYNGYALAWMMF